MKAIIFDCDGTLVDSEMAHYSAWSRVAKKHGVAFTLDEYACCVGHPSDKASQILADKIGKVCAEELKENKHLFYYSLIRPGLPPIEDTIAFLYRLAEEQKSLGYKLAVASASPREEIALHLQHLKVEPLFDLLLSGKDDLTDYKDPEGVNKPKPYIYLEAAKRLGIHPKECVAIEDSHTGVMASFKAGCVTVAVPTPFSFRQDFSAADLILSSFKDYSISQFLADCKKKAFAK